MNEKDDLLVINLGHLSESLLKSKMLFFRDDGTVIRNAILSKVKSSNCNIVALDFKNIEVIDFSCSDEIVVTLQEHNSWLDGKKMILLNLSKGHMENIESALEKNKKAIWIQEQGNAFLLGKTPKHLVRLLEIVRERKNVTARQIADETDEEIASVSVKLGKLFKEGLILRTQSKSQEGMEYVYKSIV